MFIVINLRTKQAWMGADGDPLLFEEADAAKIASIALNNTRHHNHIYTRTAVNARYTGEPNNDLVSIEVFPEDKWQVRPAYDDPHWRDRERKAIREEYACVPWQHDASWVSYLASHENVADHFVHISSGKRGFLAYTPSDKHGRENRKVVTTFDRYFAKLTDLDPALISKWRDQWKRASGDVKVMFGGKMEDFLNAYVNGPDSCMKGDSSRFFGRSDSWKIGGKKITGKPPHPVEAYASGDFEVAWISDRDRITARTITIPSKKKYIRLFGDQSSSLEAILRAEGYTRATTEDAVGLRFLKMEIAKCVGVSHAVAVPYIDVPGLRVHHNPDDPDHLYLVKSEYGGATQEARGWCTMHPPFTSERSGDVILDGSMPVDVFVTRKKTQVWSYAEIDQHAFYDASMGYYYDNSKIHRKTILSNSGYTIIAVFEDEKTKKYEFCELMKMEFVGNGYEVIVGSVGDEFVKEKWSEFAMNKFGFWDRFTDQPYARWLMSIAPCSDGETSIYNEHRYYKGMAPYAIKGEVNRLTVDNVRRRFEIANDGHTIVAVYPDDVEPVNPEQRRTPTTNSSPPPVRPRTIGDRNRGARNAPQVNSLVNINWREIDVARTIAEDPGVPPAPGTRERRGVSRRRRTRQPRAAQDSYDEQQSSAGASS